MSITTDDVEQFLARLVPEEATSSERYRRLRASMIKFFEWRNREDAAELSDETIGRLVRNLHAGVHIENPSSYIYAVAMNVYREDVRYKAKLALLDVHDLDTVPAFESNEGFEEGFEECARRCFNTLSDDEKLALEQYYSDSRESREDRARQMGVSVGTLRVRIHRLRMQLKRCHQECMKGSD